ncbi:MAG: class I SAM-dependent methyltransferase [Chitinispirillaceae bacterium]|nr:class I SAM-dependent methyltransferase [Chitinispirillaceae bacterium]
MRKRVVNKSAVKLLRSRERVKMLEVERVVELCLEQLFITRVLDVGSGSGLFAEAFALRNLEVTGIDKNPAMVKTASDLVPNARFREGSAEMLPFADRSFDLVFIAHVLNESDDPLLILREARRVAVSRVALLEWPYRPEEDKGPPLEERFKPDEIKKLVRLAGLRALKIIDLNFMVFYRMKPA